MQEYECTSKILFPGQNPRQIPNEIWGTSTGEKHHNHRQYSYVYVHAPVWDVATRVKKTFDAHAREHAADAHLQRTSPN